MPALHFTTYIEGPIEKIFALISRRRILLFNNPCQ